MSLLREAGRFVYYVVWLIGLLLLELLFWIVVAFRLFCERLRAPKEAAELELEIQETVSSADRKNAV